MVSEIQEYLNKIDNVIWDCGVSGYTGYTYDDAKSSNGNDFNVDTVKTYIALVEDAIIQNKEHAKIALKELSLGIAKLQERFSYYSTEMATAELMGDRNCFIYLQEVHQNFETFIAMLKKRCAVHRIQLPELSKESEDCLEPQPVKIPSELDNDKAKRIFEKAFKNGVIWKDESGFYKMRTKALVAYFGECMNSFLGISTGVYNGKKKNSWKPYESLFNLKNLAGDKRDYEKHGSLPKCYEEIDQLFK